MEENMKKVLATTMATLLFGLSFPVNTFALPNNQSVTINQNSNMQLIQNPQNGQHLGSVISSESVNNVKPQGYFAVTFKVDGSKGTLTIGSQETNKSELIYYVDPNANVKLKDVGNIGAKVKDSTKYEIDKSWRHRHWRHPVGIHTEKIRPVRESRPRGVSSR